MRTTRMSAGAGHGRRGSAAAFVVAVMAAAAVTGCGGGEAPPATSEASEAPGAVPAPAEAVVGDLTRTVETAHQKLVSLAQAMPEERWAWRPMEGVRSVGEVYQHVAADNWFGPAIIGIASPEDVGVTDDYETVAAYQARSMTREEILAELERSFVHLEGAAEAFAARAGEELTLGGSTITVADLWVRLTVHMHEHLGQSVAYARANEVVPPWSR